MLRTPSYLEQVEDPSILSVYTESDPKHKESLDKLKGMFCCHIFSVGMIYIHMFSRRNKKKIIYLIPSFI